MSVVCVFHELFHRVLGTLLEFLAVSMVRRMFESSLKAVMVKLSKNVTRSGF